MAAFSTIATVAGIAISAVGAVQQGFQAKAQSEFQAKVARQQAQNQRQQAAAAEGDFRRRQDRLMARRRAIMGGSGVESGTGSPLLVSEDFAGEAELGARRIRAGGETRGTRLDTEASLFQTAGRNAVTSGFFRAGSSLLKGAGQVDFS